MGEPSVAFLKSGKANQVIVSKGDGTFEWKDLPIEQEIQWRVAQITLDEKINPPEEA